MNWEYIGQLFVGISDGVQYTLILFFVTIILSVPLGLMLAFARMSKYKLVSGITAGYIWVMRGTPLLLQLFFFCYGITVIQGIGPYLVMDRIVAALIAFVLNYAAYFCEIFRGGILSIDKGQYEASKVLGFSRWQRTVRIVVPQMLRVCLPAISNESITLVKDTALVTAIGIMELMYFTKAAVNRDSNPLAFVVVAVFYLAMTYILTQFFKYLEKRFSY